MGLAARPASSSALMMFFLYSAATKFGSGFPGSLIPTVNAHCCRPFLSREVTTQIRYRSFHMLSKFMAVRLLILFCRLLSSWDSLRGQKA